MAGFDTSQVTTMEKMFYNCYHLISVNLTGFNTAKVTTMEEMFYNCENLEKLILGEFKNALTTEMAGIFYNCPKLKSLDLSKFYTPRVNSMKNMFYDCNSLTSLDLSSFDTSQVTNMDSMFFGCKNIIMLILSHFKTNKVKMMDNMFNSCSKLKYLDFRNINSQQVTNMAKMFYGCSSLIYINLYNLNKQPATRGNMFTNAASRFSYCINDVSKITGIIKLLDQVNAKKDCSGDHYFIIPKEIKHTDAPAKLDPPDKNDDKEQNESSDNEEDINEKYNSTSINIDQDFSIQIDNTLLSEEINEIDEKSTDLTLESSIIEKIQSSIIIERENKKIYEEIINNIIQDFEGSGEEKLLKGEDNHYFLISPYDNELMKEKIKNKSNQFSIIDLGECENVLREKNNLNKNTSLIILSLEKLSNISSERNLQYEVYDSLTKKKLNLSVCQEVPINIYVPVVLSEKLNNLYNELQDLGYDLFNINNVFYQDICTPYKSENGTDVLLSDRIEHYYKNDETKCQSGCQLSEYSFETEKLKCECNIIDSEINTEQKSQEVQSESKLIYKSFYDVLKFSNYKVLKCYKLAFNLSIFKNNKGNIIVIVLFATYIILFIMYLINGKKELEVDMAKIIIDDKKKDINNSPNLKNAKTIIHNNINNQLKSKDGENNLPIKNINNDKSIYNNQIIQNNNNNSLIMRINIKKKKKRRNIKLDFPPKKILNNRIDDLKINDDIILTRDKYRKMTLKKIMAESNREINETENAQKKKLEIFEKTKEEKLDDFQLNELEYEIALNLDNRKFLEIY